MGTILRIVGAGGIAAALMIGLLWASLRSGTATATAADVMAAGVRAASNLKSIHLKCRMRTAPADNFSYLDLDQEFVVLELWKRYCDPMQWRVEKPGRVAVMDGQQTIMLIANRTGVKFDVASPSAFDTDWLHRLAAVDKVLSRELIAAEAGGYDLTLTRTEDAGDTMTHVVTIDVKTKNSVGEYLKNKFLETSDTRRVYTFDRQTGRLENAKVYCRASGKEVLVLEVLQIDYDAVIADSLFALDIPENVVWHTPPECLPDNEKYEKMTPKEAARTFFDACSRKDWEEAVKFFGRQFDDRSKQYLGGLEIVRLGEPFQAKPYPGWFVPYELRMTDGQLRKHNLALRKDNPAKRFVVDGGL